MFNNFLAPTVIVGMGGSGTRAAARVLREAGLFTGTNTNGVKEDALEFAEFDYCWVPPFLAAYRGGRELEDSDAMIEQHRACVAAHRASMPEPEGPWGWKHSPSGHLLPFLAEQFPGLRVIHVVRDGRDMALGQHGSRTHTLRLGRAVLDGDPTPVLPGTDQWRGRTLAMAGEPEATVGRQAMFWARTNSEIADWASDAGFDAYLRVRLEDLGSRPRDGVASLVAFAGLAVSGKRVDELASLLQVPATTGRWRAQDPGQLEEVLHVAGDQLDRFGYLGAG